MSSTITSYSMEEIRQEIKKELSARDNFILGELDKLRERINELNTVVGIYIQKRCTQTDKRARPKKEAVGAPKEKNGID